MESVKILKSVKSGGLKLLVPTMCGETHAIELSSDVGDVVLRAVCRGKLKEYGWGEDRIKDMVATLSVAPSRPVSPLSPAHGVGYSLIAPEAGVRSIGFSIAVKGGVSGKRKFTFMVELYPYNNYFAVHRRELEREYVRACRFKDKSYGFTVLADDEYIKTMEKVDWSACIQKDGKVRVIDGQKAVVEVLDDMRSNLTFDGHAFPDIKRLQGYVGGVIGLKKEEYLVKDCSKQIPELVEKMRRRKKYAAYFEKDLNNRWGVGIYYSLNKIGYFVSCEGVLEKRFGIPLYPLGKGALVCKAEEDDAFISAMRYAGFKGAKNKILALNGGVNWHKKIGYYIKEERLDVALRVVKRRVPDSNIKYNGVCYESMSQVQRKFKIPYIKDDGLHRVASVSRIIKEAIELQGGDTARRNAGGKKKSDASIRMFRKKFKSKKELGQYIGATVPLVDKILKENPSATRREVCQIVKESEPGLRNGVFLGLDVYESYKAIAEEYGLPERSVRARLQYDPNATRRFMEKWSSSVNEKKGSGNNDAV